VADGLLPFDAEILWVFSPIEGICLSFTLAVIRVLGMKDNKRKGFILWGCSGQVQFWTVSFVQFF